MVRVPQKILVAPLDWGLGHATRCIPIIRYLLAQGHLVYLGITPQTAVMLQTEFPSLPCINFPAYNISYSKTAQGLPWKILKQVPRVLRTIREEHACLLQAVAEHGIDRIISDNRYGLWHPSLPSVIICHQLQLQIPQSDWLQRLANQWHRKWLQKFSACWVPDTLEQELGGELTVARNHLNVNYIGPLSRFECLNNAFTSQPNTLLLLSGPEPQRTQLEQALIAQHKALQGRVVLVRGTLTSPPLTNVPSHWQVYNLLHASELAPLLHQAECVVCRSGYSTLMDLAILGKKALLIPTPGQTEQEYLANYWATRGGYIHQAQEALNLDIAMKTLATINAPMPLAKQDLLATEIETWLHSTHSS